MGKSYVSCFILTHGVELSNDGIFEESIDGRSR